jgi:hypothetical protein
MKIDIKKPIYSSLFIMIIILILSIIIMYITKPTYIMEVSKEGHNKKSIYLLLTYSMLFSVSIGITVFLYRTASNKSESTEIYMGFNPRSYKPKVYTV